jgi:drug/metabolite transporter (DMT)-like permease
LIAGDEGGVASPAEARGGPHPHTAAATVWVLVSACCFSSIAIWVVLATRTGAPLLTVLAGRYVLSAVALLPLARRKIPAAGGVGRLVRLALVLGPIQAALAWISLTALDYIPAGTLVILFYTYPAWVAVFGALRGVERIDRERGIALLLSFAGIAAIVGLPGAAAVNPIGAGLALGAAVIYAVYIPLVERMQLGIAPEATAFALVVIVGALFIVAGMVTGRLTLALAPMAWIAIAGVALVGTAMAFVLFFRGLAVLGPVRTAIISCVEPFSAALLGAVVLGQPITRGTAIGGVLVAAAVMLLQRTVAKPATH